MGWYNSDGLYVKFSTEEATPGKAGGYRTAGPQQMAELTIADASLITANPVIQDYNLVIPKYARIEKVEVIVTTLLTDTSAGSVLNVGLKKTDNSTELDYEAFVKALPLASLNVAGETTVLTAGVTYAGDLIGTTLSENGYLTVDYSTEAFLTGAFKVRIYYTRV